MDADTFLASVFLSNYCAFVLYYQLFISFLTACFDHDYLVIFPYLCQETTNKSANAIFSFNIFIDFQFTCMIVGIKLQIVKKIKHFWKIIIKFKHMPNIGNIMVKIMQFPHFLNFVQTLCNSVIIKMCHLLFCNLSTVCKWTCDDPAKDVNLSSACSQTSKANDLIVFYCPTFAMSQRRWWQNVRFYFHLYTPVVALLAELLLEVAQGETVALHGPPVGDLLTTEEIRHHCLATAHPVASYRLFTLLHPESRQEQKRLR